MFCFQDRTFCPFHEACTKGLTCKSALTEEIVAAAEAWFASWVKDRRPGEQAPVMVHSSEPSCFVPVGEESCS